MGKIYKYFSSKELKCKCNKCDSVGYEMNDEFMEKIILLREDCGFPFIVSSAFRCSKYNMKVSLSTGFHGAHTVGKAMDIKAYGNRAYYLIKKAYEHNFNGIGIYQRGEFESRFVHLDNCNVNEIEPRPAIWSY